MGPVLEPKIKDGVSLSPLEVESIGLFISFFKVIGLQKSIGEIYGLLFVSYRPLAMDEIVKRLGISLGAASQGLKVLRSVGAVKTTLHQGDRKDYFIADLELSRFATSFIKDQILPEINSSLARVKVMESLVESLEPHEKSPAEERLERLKHWVQRSETMLPWILKFLVGK